MFRPVCICTSVCVLFFGVTVANAAMLTTSTDDTGTTVSGFLTPWDTTTPLPNPLVLNRFNPAAGTLTSIKLIAEVDVITDLTLTAQTDTTLVSGSAGAIMAVDIDPPLPTPGADPDGFFLNPDALFPGTPIFVAAGASINFDGLAATAMDMYTTTDAGVLAAFTGAGTLSFNANANGTTTLTTVGGNFDQAQVTTAGARLTVEYTFDPADPPMGIPEPSSAMLMALAGVVGLAGCTRRRFRRR